MKRYGLVTCLILFLLFCTLAYAEEETKWAGIDETVVEKIASEHGREASGPLINTDQGDLLLFLFLLAGAVGGFVAGYYYRVLVETKPDLKPKILIQDVR